ncbi:hypothetical protein [Dietzia alimentaria]|uniref:hypothetical protein n=1 Tax=Dietzia alimentaria TaxID=665550 RepID=UPI00029B32BE|nr:hypothetical protein [Dietzia alimentaria]
MTTTQRPTAAGVFIVRDADVCAALEQLLAPHRIDEGAARATEMLNSAEAHASKLTGDPASHLPETIEQLLDHVHKDGQTRSKQDLADARDQRDALAKKLRDTEKEIRVSESSIARTERDLDEANAQLKDALAKITSLESDVATAGRDSELAEGELNKLRNTVADLHSKLEKTRATPAPAVTTGSRNADKKAFDALATRMDNQALGQPKSVGDVLRLAARAIRDEIDTVYANTKKAS